MKRLILFANPFTIVFWLTGLLVVPFISKLRQYRLISFALFCSFVLLFIARGKWYYFFSILLGLIMLGAVCFEQLIQKRRWGIHIYLVMLSLAGIYLLPQGIPVIKLNRYIELYHLEPNEDGKIPLSFDNYYSVDIWNQILGIVQRTYTDLPATEQKKCFVLGRHYAMAGAVNLLGEKYGLPKAFSLHSSFEWIPEFNKDVIIIAIGESNWEKQNWKQYFEHVEEVGAVENKYANKKNEYCYRIFLCKKSKYNSIEFKKLTED